VAISRGERETRSDCSSDNATKGKKARSKPAAADWERNKIIPDLKTLGRNLARELRRSWKAPLT